MSDALCPHCHHPLTRQQLASLLGRSAKGKKKPVSKAESQRRAARLAKARESRWKK